MQCADNNLKMHIYSDTIVCPTVMPVHLSIDIDIILVEEVLFKYSGLAIERRHCLWSINHNISRVVQFESK